MKNPMRKNPPTTEESEAYPHSDESSDSDGVVPEHEIPAQYESSNTPQLPQGNEKNFVYPEGLREYEPIDRDEDDEMDFWSAQLLHVVQNGMVFSSKEELMLGIHSWNIKCNKEMYVVESTTKKWRARCYTTNPKCNINLRTGPPCAWYANARRKTSDSMWQLTRWVDSHNYYGTVVGNSNRCMKSKDIATRILHHIRDDIAFPVKSIQAHIKDRLGVDISYSKGWRARQDAVERIYDSWLTNFRELPTYVDALKKHNPTTVVDWLHEPKGSSDIETFKYVFWAFGPVISAFQYCMPVISVDGTFLKGSYKGKLLITVTKNANNLILRLCFAIVDEETAESWTWFFHHLWEHIARHRGKKLCVISDRHKGIINAVSNLAVWRRNAIHRFCLRHIRSNLMQKFKIKELKELCWDIGSTTQQRKYDHSVDLMKGILPEAWEYLEEIGEDRWTLVHDRNNRRWGTLTTNISESFNHALKGIRMMPIKAIIERTFDKTVEHFLMNNQVAHNCRTRLAPYRYEWYQIRYQNSRHHRLQEYSYVSGRYRVISKIQTNECGGNDYIVDY
ncbi:uncharacterized protein LOC110932455 [Helianthus annuus]|uniref:uncharacterized protein LOC110932455 n=1 Tax=Helianthus annuus TaxID=4232 RepID=UPI000B8FC8C9|nr:uncharacterized protein LOC110932455 [Helianthus annuus]